MVHDLPARVRVLALAVGLAGPLTGATLVVTQTGDAGPGSMRQAVLDANATPELDRIEFAIAGPGPHRIAPASPLPALTVPVIVDGTSQPGYAGRPLIELDGAGAGAAATGLQLLAGQSTVRGLSLTRWGADGLRIEGPGANLVRANHLGADPGGTNAPGNGRHGLLIANSPDNAVGGADPADANLIAGNGDRGVAIAGNAASNNVVLGNRIGTDIAGRLRRPNLLGGIAITEAAFNRVADNLIAGNGGSGLLLALPGSRQNRIEGNRVGVDVTGTNALANGLHGIALDRAPGNIIGGADPALGNVISGNTNCGVFISGPGAGTNILHGNRIGTDAAGTRALPNGVSGVRIETSANRVGGSNPGEGNVISGNGEDGLLFLGASATLNVVAGNRVGSDATGTAPLGNRRAGVHFAGAPGNVLGGTAGAAPNVISANRDAGVLILGAAAAANRLEGNRIGTDLTGELRLGNALEGVYVADAADTVIGGAFAGAGNLIAANGTIGIYLTNSLNTVIQGNRIGSSPSGAARGHPYHAIELEAGCRGTEVGGAGPNAGNVIGHSQGIYSGVRIRDGATANRILGNSISDNGGLGIDLGAFGVLENDVADADTGANALQNHPILEAVYVDTGLTVIGHLDTRPAQVVRVDVYASPRPDPSGYGEGARHLGGTNVTTDLAGHAPFTLHLDTLAASGDVVAATATGPDGSTSEFGPAVPVQLRPSLTATATNGTFTLAWPATNAGFAVWEATNLWPPVAWSAGAGQVTTSGVWLQFSTPATNGHRFYRLTR